MCDIRQHSYQVGLRLAGVRAPDGRRKACVRTRYRFPVSDLIVERAVAIMRTRRPVQQVVLAAVVALSSCWHRVCWLALSETSQWYRRGLHPRLAKPPRPANSQQVEKHAQPSLALPASYWRIAG